jgi:hypothetical protein
MNPKNLARTLIAPLAGLAFAMSAGAGVAKADDNAKISSFLDGAIAKHHVEKFPDVKSDLAGGMKANAGSVAQIDFLTKNNIRMKFEPSKTMEAGSPQVGTGGEDYYTIRFNPEDAKNPGINFMKTGIEGIQTTLKATQKLCDSPEGMTMFPPRQPIEGCEAPAKEKRATQLRDIAAFK